MPSNFSKRLYLIFIALLLSHNAEALNCYDTRQIIKDHFLATHLHKRTFDQDLSKTVLDTYIKSWDPGKMFFLESDVEQIQNQFNAKLPDMIDKRDCSAVTYVYNLFSKRYKERYPVIHNQIKANHDFKLDEFYNLDRKNLGFAKNRAELDERWRKRIKYQILSLTETVDKPKEVLTKLAKKYELAFKRHKELKTNEIFGSFLDAFASSLDPHTSYFSKDQLEDFQINNSLSLEGIGALLRPEDGITKVASLVPGGAAQKGGQLKVNDKIVGVAQSKGEKVDVIDMDIRNVVKLIRGPQGTEVILTVKRDGKTLHIPVIREKIQLTDRAAKSTVHEVVIAKGKASKDAVKHKVGVIDLPSFYVDFSGQQENRKDFRSSSRDMLNELLQLQKEKVDAVLVDLRGNAGGGLFEAINIAGLFNGAGPVVQTKGRQPKAQVSSHDKPAIYSGPLVILIDQQSASASEILAGAIKDFERGVIVGSEQTFGKGTVQRFEELDKRLGAFKVTVSKYYSPSGSSTQRRGVNSDIVIPSVYDEYEIGERFYDLALPWSKVPKAKYKTFNQVKPFLAELAKSSKSRISASEKFKEIKKEIEEYRTKNEDKYRVSLKEKSKKEKEKEEKERKELEDKRERLSDAYGNITVPISEDPNLAEAVFIATDYARLISKKPLASLSLVEEKVPPPPAPSKTAPPMKIQESTMLPKK